MTNKERLEAISSIADVSAYPDDLVISAEDLNWLIQRAQRCEELEERARHSLYLGSAVEVLFDPDAPASN